MIYSFLTLTDEAIFQKAADSFKEMGFIVLKDFFQKEELKFYVNLLTNLRETLCQRT